MTAHDVDDDGLEPLRGNVHAITNEHERLVQLAAGLEELGLFVRNARVDAWTGLASDLAMDSRRRIASVCLRAATAHASAAGALAQYRDMLAVLQPMANSLIAEAHTSTMPGVTTAARASLRRFRTQLADLGWIAAAQMKQAAYDLHTLQSVLPDLPVLPAFTVPSLVLPPVDPAPAPAVPQSARPHPSATPDRHLPNPFRFGDPAEACLVVQLNNQLLFTLQGAH
jgi:hypothetical protein